MHILGTLDEADAGELVIAGQEVQKMNRKALARFRNQEIGFVFQFHHLLPEFSAIENIMIPGLIAGRKESEVQDEGMKLLEYLHLQNRSSHKPSQLSGGEQQRVALARAMINRPSILLADEPTGNLDDNLAKELHKLLLSMRADFNQTIVIVTHDLELAKGCDRIVQLENGQIKEIERNHE
jgi:lipoprotein-releasing system ATP-binding protein